ncbi:MAG: helix-turn-helix transcriptional regulator [Elusimicrobia bacterium]|nr:helix-turn-helix transcriptional regulator [Elusimicrobiota bacterium]
MLPTPENTPLGGRLRFLRKRQGLTQAGLSRRTGISPATICKLERGGETAHPEIVGKLLAYFGRDAAEAFPESKDAVDELIPVKDFGSWLRNFRVRKGLQQVELAKLLGMSKASVSAYEQNQTRPGNVVLKRLRKVFKLNGEFDKFL